MATTYSVTAWRNPRSATWSKYGEYCAGWTNQSKITAIDGSGATLPSGEGINNSRKTAYLVAYNYGFVVPSNAVIVGVEIRIQKKKTTNGGTAKDYLVCLRNGPVNAPRNIGRNIARGDLWSKSYAMYGYGSSRDKLGANLTPAIVNSSTFGINFRAIGTVSTYSNIGVDGIQMRIHYAITSNTTTPPTIIEPENPDNEPTVIVNPDAEYYGKNVVPYEISHPTTLMSDVYRRNNNTASTDTTDGISIENGWYKIQGFGTSNTLEFLMFDDRKGQVPNGMVKTSPLPISAGQVLSLQAKLKVKTGKAFRIGIRWLDSGKNWLSSSYCADITGTDNEQLVTHTATAPAKARYYVLIFIVVTDLATNEYFYIKEIMVELGNTVSLYRPSKYHVTPFKLGNRAEQSNLGSSYYGLAGDVNNLKIEDGNYVIHRMSAHSGSLVWQSTYYQVSDFRFNIPTNVKIMGLQGVQKIKNQAGGTTAKQVGFYIFKRHPTEPALISIASGYGRSINKATQTQYPNDSTKWIYQSIGGSDDLMLDATGGDWNTLVLDPNFINSADLMIGCRYENLSTTANAYVYTDAVWVRVWYAEIVERKTVQPNREDIELTDDETIYANVNQAPTKYYNSVKPIEFIHPPNQIRQQIGYIGTVNVIRGHHFEQISRKNDLLKETAGGAVNYSKKGTIEEDRPLSIKIPKRAIKQLEGMVDIQGIVPMDTVITMDDNDPYAMKGYVILHGIKHKRTNDLISECDIDVEFVSKDLYSPLTVDYLIKTTPPLDANIITNTENSVFYYEADTIKFIQNKTIYSNTNTPTYTYTDNGLVVSVDNDDIARIISNDTVLAPLKVVANFVYTKGSGKNIQVNLGQPNTALSDRIVLISDATTLQLRTYDRAGTQLTTETITNNANGTDYTVTINVDINGLVTATVDITDGSAITTYTFTPVTITDIADGLRSKIRIQSTSPTFDTILYEHGITKKLFSDNIDTTIRNIIHIPKPLGVNIQPDFVRQTQEGELYCYLNPSRDILFTVNPANFFDTSVKLIDDSGTRLLTTDMVINRQSEITIENSLIRVVFDVINNQIKIFGFLYGWMQIATLSLANMFHIKPIQVSFDMVHIQVGETKWLLRRGKPFVEVYHPHNDLEILDNFTHYWHDNGSGVGVVKEIENSTEPLNVNTLFYVNIYKESDNLGMQIFRPRLDNLTVKTIIKSEETGIGWYNKLAEVNERHYERALEYLAKSNQDIYVYLG